MIQTYIFTSLPIANYECRIIGKGAIGQPEKRRGGTIGQPQYCGVGHLASGHFGQPEKRGGGEDI